jgi:hypothetical protein
LAELADIPLPLMEGHYRDLPDDVLAWLAPREGGPVCRSHLGPLVHMWYRDLEPFLPLSWESLRPDPLHILLNHSDCDGDIAPEDCAALADRLEELLPLLPDEDDPGHIGNWCDKTKRFRDGLRLAASRNEALEFH